MKGFTLIELIITVAIVVIIAAIIIPAVTGDHAQTEPNTATEQGSY